MSTVVSCGMRASGYGMASIPAGTVTTTPPLRHGVRCEKHDDITSQIAD